MAEDLAKKNGIDLVAERKKLEAQDEPEHFPSDEEGEDGQGVVEGDNDEGEDQGEEGDDPAPLKEDLEPMEVGTEDDADQTSIASVSAPGETFDSQSADAEDQPASMDIEMEDRLTEDQGESEIVHEDRFESGLRDEEDSNVTGNLRESSV
jgi:hypothetical protein